MTTWQKVTDSPTDPADPMALEYTLTPYERSLAALAQVELERNRRLTNEKDGAK